MGVFSFHVQQLLNSQSWLSPTLLTYGYLSMGPGSETHPLCSHCLHEGVPALLDTLRDLDNEGSGRHHASQRAGKRRRGRHGWISHGWDDDEQPAASHGLSVRRLGMSARHRISLGAARDIFGRRGCPVCDIVVHVLPSEYRGRLSHETISLVLSDSLPSTWTFIGADVDARSESGSGSGSGSCGVFKLYIVTRNWEALGCIQFYTPSPERARRRRSRESREAALRDPWRDSWHMLPAGALQLIILRMDSVQVVNECTEKALHRLDEDRKQAAEKLAPVLSVLSDAMADGVEKITVDDDDEELGEGEKKTIIQINPKWARKLLEATIEAAQQLGAGSRNRKLGIESGSKDGFRILLIDVEGNQLTETTTTSEDYVALSYVWGTGPVFETRTDNRKELEAHGALQHKPLPRIVRDAMEFTRRMGKRYLWVDALCIEQNPDSQQKAMQIKNMDSIYRDAYLTLVAWTAVGSDSALPGVSESSMRPQMIQRQLHGMVLENRLSEDLPYLLNYNTISHYNTRAWTLQERMLSTRCLFFHEREAFLVDPTRSGMFGVSCLAATLREDFNLRAGNEDRINMSLRIYRMVGSESSVPHLEPYARLVEEYTKLDLKYNSDRLNAFTGMVTSMRSTIGHVVAGMPIPASPLCLLWDFAETQPPRNPMFPSWSWAGWDGQISYLDWSNNTRSLMVGPMSVSETPEGVRSHLWQPERVHSPSQAEASIGYAPEAAPILHFSAETMEKDGHIFILIAAEKGESPEGKMKAMKLKWGERCTERVGNIQEFSRGDWEKADPKQKEIHLQ